MSEDLDRENSKFSAKIHNLVLTRNMLCCDNDSEIWKNLMNKQFFETIEALTYPNEIQNSENEKQ